MASSPSSGIMTMAIASRIKNSEAEKAKTPEKLKQQHKVLGYRLLLDENVVLEKNGQKISLIGVQNWGRGFMDAVTWTKR